MTTRQGSNFDGTAAFEAGGRTRRTVGDLALSRGLRGSGNAAARASVTAPPILQGQHPIEGAALDPAVDDGIDLTTALTR